MIGRLKPILNVLDAEDHETYKAHYCGICAAAKVAHGRRAALGHSSELVFVSLILEGLEPEGRPYRRGRVGCTVLPPLPRAIAEGPPEHSRAVAAGLLATLRLDLEDAESDHERRLKRFLCRPLRGVDGPIDPEAASREPFVTAAIAHLPPDPVASMVSGVIGSVFKLAGHGERITADGCRIGHAMGRLMDRSDALDDYFADERNGLPNRLRGSDGARPDPVLVGLELHEVLDDLDDLVADLPLVRHSGLLSSLINIHARARLDASLAKYRKAAGLPAAVPARVAVI